MQNFRFHIHAMFHEFLAFVASFDSVWKPLILYFLFLLHALCRYWKYTEIASLFYLIYVLECTCIVQVPPETTSELKSPEFRVERLLYCFQKKRSRYSCPVHHFSRKICWYFNKIFFTKPDNYLF